jgi:peroxiredoxin
MRTYEVSTSASSRTRTPIASVSAVALAAMEARAGLRSSGFKLLAVCSLLLGWIVGAAPGRGVALSAWSVGEAAWRYLAFVVIVWMSLIAVRDTVTRTDLLVYSKPQPTERLVLARFLAAFTQVGLILCLMFGGALLNRLFSGNGISGFPVYLQRLVGAAGVLFFTAAASYSLALLARTPLAGTVVGLYWVLTLAGKSYLPKAYFPAYSQNLPAYLFLGVALLGTACLFHRRQRRGKARAALWAVCLTPAAFALSVVALVHTVNTGHEPPIRVEPALEMMGSQNAVLGERAPGFRLPAAAGRMTSLADYPGRVLVIALWSPTDPYSIVLLDHLEEIQGKYGSRGVQVVAVCVSEDVGAASVFARGEGLHYPVVADWSTHNAEKLADTSSLADAYQVSRLPHVAVTDRRRTLRTIISGLDNDDGRLLEKAIQERLSREPE